MLDLPIEALAHPSATESSTRCASTRIDDAMTSASTVSPSVGKRVADQVPLLIARLLRQRQTGRVAGARVEDERAVGGERG